jgi:aspartokinase/homoserine dehydrogenase 1
MRDVRIVSVFGQGMRHVPGISAKVYSVLGSAGINVVASSQGGEELSISVVVSDPDAEPARTALLTLK